MLAVIMTVASAWIWSEDGGSWLGYVAALLAGAMLGVIDWLLRRRHRQPPPSAKMKSLLIALALIVLALLRTTLPESLLAAILPFSAGVLLVSAIPTGNKAAPPPTT